MRGKIGKACVALGILLVIGAFALFFYNQAEARRAKETAERTLEQIMEHFQRPQVSENTQSGEESTQAAEITGPNHYKAEMPVVEIDGYGYIGYLSIPDLGKVLPIHSEWDYERLQIAPCRYKGGIMSGDLILCAHNYASHFGDIARLDIGAKITFTDMNGIVTSYEVAEITELPPTAIEEMESGEYPLTLFTCTYGGQTRITVRCIKVQK